MDLKTNPAFFVSLVSPLKLTNEQSISVSGIALNEVRRAELKTRTETLSLPINTSADALDIDISSFPLTNCMFFIFLYDDNDAISPIGPFIRPI